MVWRTRTEAFHLGFSFAPSPGWILALSRKSKTEVEPLLLKGCCWVGSHGVLGHGGGCSRQGTIFLQAEGGFPAWQMGMGEVEPGRAPGIWEQRLPAGLLSFAVLGTDALLQCRRQ